MCPGQRFIADVKYAAQIQKHTLDHGVVHAYLKVIADKNLITASRCLCRLSLTP
jgi:hypothetical protein